MLDVYLLGCGGMMPLPERMLTSLYLRNEGKAILIDCGEGTQTAIRMAGMRFKTIESLFITHLHADHVSGLPGFLLTLGNEDRTEPLKIYGPVGTLNVVKSLCVIVPELPYEIIVYELSMNETTHISSAGLEIDAVPVNHGIPCLGYCVELKRKGMFDPVRAKEKGIPIRLWSILQRGEEAEGFSPGDVLGAARKGLKILYSTDTRPVPSLHEYGCNADLLILEGMFGEVEKKERAELTHHMMMQEAARIASECGAKELWLTHFSPATPKPDEFIDEIRMIFENTHMGFDGKSITLKFED